MGTFLDKANEDNQAREPLTAGSHKDLKIIKFWEKKETKNPGEYQYKYGTVSKSHEGFAALKLTLRDEWLDDAVVALALGSDKDAVAAGELTAVDVDKASAKLSAQAAHAVAEANTPDELVAEKTEETLKKILTNIRIKVGTMLRLQKWAGVEPSLVFDPQVLVGTVFAGKVEDRGQYGMEVQSVYGTPKGYVAPAREESFATA